MSQQALAEDSMVHVTNDRRNTRCGKPITALNDTRELLTDAPECEDCKEPEAGAMSTSDGLGA